MARFKQASEERAFKYYVTDSLRGIPQRKHIIARFCDVLDESAKPVDNRSAEEIIQSTINGAGLKV